MVVQHNLQAMNANRMLNITTGSQSKSAEKLSSGYRINRAADDAAGLSISEKMRKQIRGLDQASTNAEDGVSAVQTAEGALTEVHSMLQRMNELAVQASNGPNSQTDRDAIQSEIEQLTTEIDRVAETTKFNETYLLKGDADGATKDVYMKGHDAGLKGTLTDGATTATFKVAAGALDDGKKVTIGGKEYTIGSKTADVQTAVDGLNAAGDKVTVNGKTYTYCTTADKTPANKTPDADGWFADDNTTTTANTIKIASGDKVTVASADGNTKGSYTAADMTDGVSNSDSSVISAEKAISLMKDELITANNIGATKTAATIADGTTYDSATGATFNITKGTAEVAEKLNFNLHVGSDADMTNKI